MKNTKLEKALRRHKGKELLPDLLSELTRVLRSPAETIVFADLDSTDSLWRMFEAKQQECEAKTIGCLKKTWPVSELKDLKEAIARLAAVTPEKELFLFRSTSEYCGAIKITSKKLLEHAFELISLDQEDLMASNEDVSYGIVLSYVTDWTEAGSAEIYELLVWGEEWLKVIAVQTS